MREDQVSFKTLVLIGLVSVSACSTSEQRKEAEVARGKKDLAAEIGRICALPELTRDIELKKLKERTGIELYCASK
jgi:hypothetical protein